MLIAVQIGGSLAKLVYFSHDEPGDVELGGRLNFLKFETDKIEVCIEFMRRLKQEYMEREGNRPSDLCVMATGGGAYKYYDKIREALGVEVQREDEMECLIIGILFLTHSDFSADADDYDRPRLLHLRNPTRSLLLQRHKPHVLHRRRHKRLPLPPRQHWLWRLHDQSLRT